MASYESEFEDIMRGFAYSIYIYTPSPALCFVECRLVCLARALDDWCNRIHRAEQSFSHNAFPPRPTQHLHFLSTSFSIPRLLDSWVRQWGLHQRERTNIKGAKIQWIMRGTRQAKQNNTPPPPPNSTPRLKIGQEAEKLGHHIVILVTVELPLLSRQQSSSVLSFCCALLPVQLPDAWQSGKSGVPCKG